MLENLKDLGYKPETNISNKTFIVPSGDRLLNEKFVICLLSDDIYFYASDSLASKPYVSSTFTRLYSTIDLPEEAEYKVFKKDWFDFLYSNRKKPKISHIDDNLTIISRKWMPNKELNKENVELFLDINSGNNPYTLIVENDYCSQIKALSGKKIIGLETNNWIFRKEELERLIDSGIKLIINIKNTCGG